MMRFLKQTWVCLMTMITYFLMALYTNLDKVFTLQDVIIFFYVTKISSLDTILNSPCYLLFNKMNKLETLVRSMGGSYLHVKCHMATHFKILSIITIFIHMNRKKWLTLKCFTCHEHESSKTFSGSKLWAIKY